MKIYQIHSYSGEWEDFRDYIIGSYLRKERAEEEMAKLEAKEKELIEHSKKCCHCPFLEASFISSEDLLSKHPDYCSDAKLKKVSYDEEDMCYEIDCENYYIKWDDATFKIKEVEVEE